MKHWGVNAEYRTPLLPDGQSLPSDAFWRNQSPAASSLQKSGKYFLIFRAAVTFPKTLHPSATKWGNENVL